MVSDDEPDGGVGVNDQSQIRDSADSMRICNDEELMLLAKRRTLLSRGDWLAFEPTKPLRLGFPAAAESEQVGRRRRIKEKTSKAPRPAQKRSLTPLFEERLEATRYLMSGALPSAQEEYIQVKVGTSAFGSRCLSSDNSNATFRASIVPRSSSLSHLSEEPMLLGADGDTFDASQVSVPEPKQVIHSVDYARLASQAVRDNHPVDFDVRGFCSDGGSGALSGHGSAEFQGHVKSPSAQKLRSTAANGLRLDSRNDNDVFDLRLQEARNQCQALCPEQNRQTSDERGFEDMEVVTIPDSPLDAIQLRNNQAPVENEEHAWKRMLGIPTQTPSSISNISNKALKSTSQHLTPSDDTVQAALPYDQELLPPNTDTLVSHQSIKRFDDPRVRHSLSGSGGKLSTISPVTMRPPAQSADDVDAEALWREFIIGSQDGESENELPLNWQRKRTKHQTESEPSRPFELSGLGTSDKATKAETTVSELLEPSASPEHNDDESPESEHDSIEDIPDEPESERAGTRNIHAASTMSMNPRRFKRAPAKDGEESRKATPGYKILRHYLKR